MQEEIENRTVTLIISAVKLTARELKAGMDKYLSEKKSKAVEKARAAPEKPSGKQTVRQLIGQNQGVSNIEITNSNIKGFERKMCIRDRPKAARRCIKWSESKTYCALIA